jgi:hypothetical protein
VLIWRVSFGIRAISCCARITILDINSRNTVFLYIFSPCFWAIISQTFPGSRRSSNYSTSCPRTPSITLASPGTSNIILAESL